MMTAGCRISNALMDKRSMSLPSRICIGLYSAAGQMPGSGKTHPNFRIPVNRPDVNAPFTAGIV